MINANKHNLRLLGKRRRLKEIQGEYKHSPKSPLKITPEYGEKLKQFHTRINKEKKYERRRLVLIIGLTLILILFLLLWIVSADYSSLIDLIE